MVWVSESVSELSLFWFLLPDIQDIQDKVPVQGLQGRPGMVPAAVQVPAVALVPAGVRVLALAQAGAVVLVAVQALAKVPVPEPVEA